MCLYRVRKTTSSSVQSTSSSVHHRAYRVHHRAYRVHHRAYRVHHRAYIIDRTSSSVQSTSSSVQSTSSSVQNRAYRVERTVSNVQSRTCRVERTERTELSVQSRFDLYCTHKSTEHSTCVIVGCPLRSHLYCTPNRMKRNLVKNRRLSLEPWKDPCPFSMQPSCKHVVSKSMCKS